MGFGRDAKQPQSVTTEVAKLAQEAEAISHELYKYFRIGTSIQEVAAIIVKGISPALTALQEKLDAAEAMLAKNEGRVKEIVDESLLQRLATAEAERDRLREALRPFAKHASGIPDNWPGHCSLNWNYDDDHGGKTNVYLGYEGYDIDAGPKIADYRSAAAALTPPTPTSETSPAIAADDALSPSQRIRWNKMAVRIAQLEKQLSILQAERGS